MLLCYISPKSYRRSDSTDSLHESIKSRVTEGRSALEGTLFLLDINESNANFFFLFLRKLAI